MSDNCTGCSKPMIVMGWNSNVDVLVCNNTSCRFYRQPIPITKGSITLADELGNVYAKQKRPQRRDKYASSTFEERLRELRKDISA